MSYSIPETRACSVTFDSETCTSTLGYLSTPYCSNHVEPSELDIQNKGTLQVYQDNVDSIITNELANEAESAVCEFSEYQGVFVLPSEFRAKDDGHQKKKSMTELDLLND